MAISEVVREHLYTETAPGSKNDYKINWLSLKMVKTYQKRVNFINFLAQVL